MRSGRKERIGLAVFENYENCKAFFLFPRRSLRYHDRK